MCKDLLMEGHWNLNTGSNFCASAVPNVLCFTEYSTNSVRFQQYVRIFSRITEFGLSPGNEVNIVHINLTKFALLLRFFFQIWG
jgi:hypothetical protein